MTTDIAALFDAWLAAADAAWDAFVAVERGAPSAPAYAAKDRRSEAMNELRAALAERGFGGAAEWWREARTEGERRLMDYESWRKKREERLGSYRGVFLGSTLAMMAMMSLQAILPSSIGHWLTPPIGLTIVLSLMFGLASLIWASILDE